MSFDNAALKCQEMGLRLCTKDELLGGVCCGTGGSCDSYLIWTSTSESGSYSLALAFVLVLNNILKDNTLYSTKQF